MSNLDTFLYSNDSETGNLVGESKAEKLSDFVQLIEREMNVRL